MQGCQAGQYESKITGMHRRGGEGKARQYMSLLMIPGRAVAHAYPGLSETSR